MVGAIRARRLAVALLALTLPLGACEKVTRAVTSQVSPCFKVLPQAHAAVHGQGTFVDVTRIRGSSAVQFPHPHVGPEVTTSTVAPRPSRDVCVVAYRGDFEPGRIDHLVGLSLSGRYALVIVSVRTQLVHAVILTDTLPKPLHSH